MFKCWGHLNKLGPTNAERNCLGIKGKWGLVKPEFDVGYKIWEAHNSSKQSY